MADCMSFPQTWEQFLHDYEFEDGRRIYTNGAKLMPSFRVKQMMEHYLLGSKSEAIREFAERLKKTMTSTRCNKNGYCHYVTEDCEIDNLVKEMVGDDNG